MAGAKAAVCALGFGIAFAWIGKNALGLGGYTLLGVGVALLATVFTLIYVVLKQAVSHRPRKVRGVHPLRVAFIHPDLGIGGAERLVVDAALGLQSHGHTIHMFTAHHDKSHCFQETSDGTLHVEVYGDWLPRSIFRRVHTLCAIIRNLYVAGVLVGKHWKAGGYYDIIFCDQISASIPLLKLSGAKILFYCHFPDQLLTDRRTFLKKLYRMPIDYIEEVTTGMADEILVNSKFTAGIFDSTFRRLSQRVRPKVLYPAINFSQYSVALSSLRLNLLLAGGYDHLVRENVEHLEELRQLANELGLTSSQVSFRCSISAQERNSLLTSCLALIYTPENEHFGIVPVEAMYVGRPVIACDSGGPKESVKDGKTGFLCQPTPKAFAEAMTRLVDRPQAANTIGRIAHRRVKRLFSLESFTTKLEGILYEMF